MRQLWDFRSSTIWLSFFFLVLIIGIGVYFSKFMKGGRDFFVGGNLIPWWAAGISLYMTSFSAWMFTGAASFAYNTGWYGLLYFILQPLGFFIGFQLSATRWRRTRVTSPVEYVQTRYNKTTQLLLSILLALSMMYWPAHHLASLSKICAPTLFPNSMTAVDLMIIGFGIIVLIYTFSGGLWAVCITDVVQFLILFSVCSVLIGVIFFSGDVGNPIEFFRQLPPLKFHHVIREKTTYTHWYLLTFWIAKIFGNAIGDRAQRYYSVKDEKSAKKAGWMAFALFMTGPILFGIPPLVGKVLWPDITQLDFFSNITKPDENIYIAVVLRYMPAGIIGLFLSAMMAASMSALDSVWNTVSSIISVDIYKNLFNPKATDRQVMVAGRITILFLFVFALIMALLIIHSDYGVFTFSNIFFSLTGVPIAIPLMLGIIVKKVSKWSAVCSIIAGTMIASIARFLLSYELGIQIGVTILITLLFYFSSVYLGRLYRQSRTLTGLAAVIFSVLMWFYVLAANDTETLSFASFQNDPQSLVHVWAVIAAAAFGVLFFISAKLFSWDTGEISPEVAEFFQRMATPVDVEKEVLKGKKEVTIFPLVGTIAMLFAALALLILLHPAARDSVFINIWISGILFAVGLLMFLAGRKQLHKLAQS